MVYVVNDSWLTQAVSPERAAERYVDSLPADAWSRFTVDVRSACGDDAVTVLVARCNDGPALGSLDAWIFAPATVSFFVK